MPSTSNNIFVYIYALGLCLIWPVDNNSPLLVCKWQVVLLRIHDVPWNVIPYHSYGLFCSLAGAVFKLTTVIGAQLAGSCESFDCCQCWCPTAFLGVPNRYLIVLDSVLTMTFSATYSLYTLQYIVFQVQHHGQYKSFVFPPRALLITVILTDSFWLCSPEKIFGSFCDVQCD